MHVRRLAAFLLGAWVAGSLFMIAIATSNLRGVDRLLEVPAPAAAQTLKATGEAAGRALLRYQAAELTRWDFTAWEWTQLSLGALLMAALAAGSQQRRPALLLCGLMLLAVLVMRVYLTPELDRLGRAVDFIPAARPSPERDRFWNFHLAYTVVEAIKLALAVALMGNLLHRSHRRTVKPEEKPRWVRAH